MKYNFSEQNKFQTWRKLWVWLAKAEKELGVQVDGQDITEDMIKVRNLQYNKVHLLYSFVHCIGTGI